MIIQCCLVSSLKVVANEKPLIFPVPQHSEVTNENFILMRTCQSSFLQTQAIKIFSRKFSCSELSDKYNVVLTIETLSDIPANRRVVVMGTINNPIIKNIAGNQLELTAKNPGNEGYVLHVSSNLVFIGGWDDAGLFLGCSRYVN